MPTKSQELLNILCVESTKRNLSDASYGSDAEYGEGVKKKILFPPLVIEE